ncbi:MAG: aminotransferase class III-fold pyridoxal phosphate-dependent enzyme [Actinobacteria bacterium]|nr:aminotransferase class III-fold pyridoxal phosphate-dependent enzyme [Actinomycetota bacterium]
MNPVTFETLSPDAHKGEWLNWSKMADFQNQSPPVIVTGEGPYAIDKDGNRFLDGVSGLFTTQIGYSHGKEIGEAAAKQLEELCFYPNWAATHPSALALTERILGLAPDRMSRVLLTSGGSESVESALKLVRQHFLAKGQPLKRKIIARRGAYHGCTMGALSLTGIPLSRVPFEPLDPNVRHAANTHQRTCLYCHDKGGCTLTCADAIEQQILAEGPDTVAAVVVEPIQNGGGLPPAEGYGARIREICDKYGVLLWCDEVITGFGRVGGWFATDRLGFNADICTFAKGITSGYAPCGGVVFTEAVGEPLINADAMYAHGFTFGGHPLACAVALANLDIMERLGVIDNVLANEDYYAAAMADVAASSDLVVEARGKGYYHSLELTDNALTAPVAGAARKHGVIVRPDVRVKPMVVTALPLICGPEQIDELTGALKAALADVAAA